MIFQYFSMIFLETIHLTNLPSFKFLETIFEIGDNLQVFFEDTPTLRLDSHEIMNFHHLPFLAKKQ